MNETLQLVVSFAAGLLLGLIFYGGLWATLSRLNTISHPGLLMMASLLIRMSLVLAGMFFVIRMGGWQSALIALAGMLLIRAILKRRLQPKKLEVAL